MTQSNVQNAMYTIVDEDSKFVHEDSIKWIGKGTYLYTNYDKPERAYPKGRIEEVLINLEKVNNSAKLGHCFTIKPMDTLQEQEDEEEFFKQFEILNRFKTDKVTITVNCGCTVVKTYTKFLWDTDADYLILGDEDADQGNFISINFDEILEVIEENEELIKIELESGDITIMLDSDYSRCNKCHEHRPVFFIRAIDEDSEEYDTRICQDCFNKIIEMDI